MSEEEKQIHLYMHSKNELGLATLCVEKDREIERLNNIINKFEKYLEETKGIYEEYTCAIKKLKELKGVDKNEKTS